MIYRHILFLLILLLSVSDTQGQGSSLTNFINCVELKNGSNNLVMNGRPYLPSNLGAEGHPYFQIKEWRSGVIYISGNSYPVDKVKYNLSTYQVVVKHQRPNGTTQNVVLSDLLLDSFQIEEHLFVNQKLVLTEVGRSVYLERIFVGKLSFYRVQRKGFIATHNKDNPNGRFSNQKTIFYLLLDGKSYKISNKKKFLACFPTKKTQIKKYMKTHSLNWKKMTKTQFAELLKFCNDQL